MQLRPPRAAVGPDSQPLGTCRPRHRRHHLRAPRGPPGGADAPPIDATDRNRFSRTIDGRYVNPAEIVTPTHSSTTSAAPSSTPPESSSTLGRRSRLFTGNARDAALLTEVRCYWTGCWIPASKCHIDHLTPWRRHGRTSPGNGAPGCGKHNRIKEHGFHAWRTESGEWKLTRPDGTPIPDHLTHWPDASESNGPPWR
ncbi:MAG: HNH endonuclease signature motif containing protein [Acidimicrobiales bacterium]